jgi:CBS domain containing-hemolysin-like protein
MSLLVWAVVSLLILVNAFFVAGEFSAVGARRNRIRRLAASGGRLARRLLPVLEDPHLLDRYIAASQVGITFSSLALGAYAQAQIAPVLEPLFARSDALADVSPNVAAVAVVLVGLAAVQVVVAELTPKAIALQYPTRTALLTVVPMQVSLRLFAWFIWLFNGSGLLLLRLVGVTYTGHRHVHSPEEIELLLAESRDGGLLEPDEEGRLNRALQLSRLTAGDLMVPRDRVTAVDVDTTLDALVATLARSPFTRLPVYEGSFDRPVGVLHTKDLTMASLGDQAPPLRSLLRPHVGIAADLPADRVLVLLRERRTHQAMVVDAEGRVAGLITLEDVLAEMLEQDGDRDEVGRG